METKKTTHKLQIKLTDAACHKRFMEMAREVEASDDSNDFDRAFKTVVEPKPKPIRHP
jgi:hypothetical protein